MNFPTIIVLLLVAAASGLALRSILQQRKQGGCCSSCRSCSGQSCIYWKEAAAEGEENKAGENRAEE